MSLSLHPPYFLNILFLLFFFFTATATTEIYTLSLHDALPISPHGSRFQKTNGAYPDQGFYPNHGGARTTAAIDRKSTRLNSSHPSISYAVFCLKKKKKKMRRIKIQGNP